MRSQIQEYFSGKTVFLTGGTGFLGKLVMEKLLRSCFEVKKIWLLMRDKQGMPPSDRLRELFNEPVFELLKTEKPNFLDKVSMFIGDCELPNLGLSAENLAMLKSDGNVIIHCAAIVRFDEGLRRATYINVRALQDLLKIANEMSHLSSFVYVSTAYSNCNTETTDEVFYKPALSGQVLLNLVDALDEDVLNALSLTIIGKWVNTYTFTKAVAEGLVETFGKNLPISVVRPSIITACTQEPLPGWVDNAFGPTRIILQASLGLLRVFRNDPTEIADIVPADYVVNSILAVSWETAETYTPGNVPLIYNYVSGSQNPITWGQTCALLNKDAYKLANSFSIWHYIYLQIPDRVSYFLAEMLLHALPAYAMDFLLFCFGKKTKYVAIYKKIAKYCEHTSYFVLRHWNFKDQNVQNLWNKMNAEDKGLFQFDIKLVNWDSYFFVYARGVRIYISKDPLETLQKAQKRALGFKIAHYTLISMMFCLFLFLFHRVASFCENKVGWL